MTNTQDPIMNPGLMPPPLGVEELRYYPSHADVLEGETWRTLHADAATIESARDGMVTVGITAYIGADDAYLYELDLTPAAAEGLALRLLRRADEIRTEAGGDGAGADEP